MLGHLGYAIYTIRNFLNILVANGFCLILLLVLFLDFLLYFAHFIRADT